MALALVQARGPHIYLFLWKKTNIFYLQCHGVLHYPQSIYHTCVKSCLRATATTVGSLTEQPRFPFLTRCASFSNKRKNVQRARQCTSVCESPKRNHSWPFMGYISIFQFSFLTPSSRGRFASLPGSKLFILGFYEMSMEWMIGKFHNCIVILGELIL